MNKTYLRSAVATLGFLAGTLITEGQSGAGAAGGGGAAAGGGATAAGAAGAGTTVRGSGTAVRGGSSTAAGAAAGGRATPAGSLNTVGGASVIEANPNTVGGSVNRGGITAPAAPATGQTGQQPGGQLGQQQGGFQGQQVGQPLTPSTAGGAAANAQAGVPLSSLPPALQNSIQNQLGGAPVQSISRDDLANGSVLRVTALQNGVPTEMRFGANGQLLSTTPLAAGTTTSPFVTGAALTPTAVVMDDLPQSVQDAVRAQLGANDANRIMQQRSATGVNYMVSYDQNGRPMMMVIGPDGRIISNGAAVPNAASATATARTTPDRTTNATRNASITLDELPDTVENVLKQTAPYAEVRTVSREQRVGGDVYVIAVRDGDRAGEISIDENGKIIRDTRRDLSALAPRAPVRKDGRAEGMPYDNLPVAIQNAIKAYASASDIRSITLGLDTDGRTVWDVIFYRDGRRDRMIVRKDGTLVRIEENVSPAMEVASNKPAVLAVGDLPQEVQDTIRRQTDNVVVKTIDTKEVANQTVYAVRYETNGTPVELLVSRDGAVIQTEGSAQTEQAGAPAPARLDREEREVVKVVDDTPGTSRATKSIGAAASTERGTTVTGNGTSIATASTEERPDSGVTLSDTPQPVQNTARKLAAGATIESISPKLQSSGMVYEVKYSEGGQLRTVQIDRNGVVQQDLNSKP